MGDGNIKPKSFRIKSEQRNQLFSVRSLIGTVDRTKSTYLLFLIYCTSPIFDLNLSRVACAAAIELSSLVSNGSNPWPSSRSHLRTSI